MAHMLLPLFSRPIKTVQQLGLHVHAHTQHPNKGCGVNATVIAGVSSRPRARNLPGTDKRVVTVQAFGVGEIQAPFTIDVEAVTPTDEGALLFRLQHARFVAIGVSYATLREIEGLAGVVHATWYDDLKRGNHEVTVLAPKQVVPLMLAAGLPQAEIEAAQLQIDPLLAAAPGGAAAPAQQAQQAQQGQQGQPAAGAPAQQAQQGQQGQQAHPAAGGGQGPVAVGAAGAAPGGAVVDVWEHPALLTAEEAALQAAAAAAAAAAPGQVGPPGAPDGAFPHGSGGPGEEGEPADAGASPPEEEEEELEQEGPPGAQGAVQAAVAGAVPAAASQAPPVGGGGAATAGAVRRGAEVAATRTPVGGGGKRQRRDD